MSNTGQTFAETEVLVAIMDGDLDQADELLDDFLSNELQAFEDQAHLLASRIRQARKRERAQRLGPLAD